MRDVFTAMCPRASRMCSLAPFVTSEHMHAERNEHLNSHVNTCAFKSAWNVNDVHVFTHRVWNRICQSPMILPKTLPVRDLVVIETRLVIHHALQPCNLLFSDRGTEPPACGHHRVSAVPTVDRRLRMPPDAVRPSPVLDGVKAKCSGSLSG